MLISDCSSDGCPSDLGRQRSAGFSANRSCRSPGLVHGRIIAGAGAVRVSSWRSIAGWWLLALLVAAGLASLGAWQLGRMYQKQALLDAVQQVLDQRMPQPLALAADAARARDYDWASGAGDRKSVV